MERRARRAARPAARDARAANPLAAARKTAEIAKLLGLSSLKIAAVIGDDVLDACKDGDLPIMEFDGTIKQLGNRLL